MIHDVDIMIAAENLAGAAPSLHHGTLLEKRGAGRADLALGLPPA